MRFNARVATVAVATLLTSFCVIQRLLAVNESLLLALQETRNSPLAFVEVNKAVRVLYAIRDDRKGNMGERRIRVLVVARGRLTEYKCKFPGGTVMVSESPYEMSENHAMPYGVYFVNFEIPTNETNAHFIEFTQQRSPWVIIPVMYNLPSETDIKKYKHQLTICLPFLFGDRYSGKSLVEFMELNRILGVEHVVVYLNDTLTNESLSKVVDFYETNKFLEVVRLTIPIASEQIWYRGQLVAITDCLYRQMGVSRFVAFHDLDEFLIPQQPQHLPRNSTLLALLNELLTGNIASIRVPTQYMDFQLRDELITLKNIRRRAYVDEDLTKCVLRPEMVFEQGIHHTSRVIQDQYKAVNGNNRILRLYHYKTKGGSEKDSRIVRDYGGRLTQRYAEAIAMIGL